MTKQEKCCGGVIIKDGKVLIVHQDNQVSVFPKGHVEKGESEIETAKREIFEETGVIAKLDKKFRYEFGYHIEEGDIDKTVVLFLGTVSASEAKKIRAQEGEIKEVLWVPIDEVDNILQFPEWKEVWRRIKEDL